MILELLEYVLTPCSWAARRLGYLRGQLGIKVRHRQCRNAWKYHLQRTQAIIRSASLECTHRRKAVILGSGLLLDVPLFDLSRTFREVILVDVVHPLKAYVLAAWYGNVRLVRADVSETADALSRVGHQSSIALPQSTPQLFCDDSEVDYVASVNLLSQLPYIPSVWLGRDSSRTEESVNSYCRSLIESHLDYLNRLPGVVTLITDTEKIQVNQNGKEVERFDILYGIRLPNVDETWIWEHVPLNHLSREAAYHRKVCAIKDVKTELIQKSPASSAWHVVPPESCSAKAG